MGSRVSCQHCFLIYLCFFTFFYIILWRIFIELSSRLYKVLAQTTLRYKICLKSDDLMIFKNDFLVFVTTLLVLTTSCSKKDAIVTPNENSSEQTITSSDLKVNENGLSQAQVILRTARGNIVFKLYPKEAPNSVTRFISLIQKGFYDGLSFHRVEENFLIQTGDPTKTGKGGSGQKLKAEFNKLQHIKGTVALARDPKDPDSADSQFYITLTTLTHLDSNYTVFGQVVEGLELLDQITLNDKIITASLQL
jgi:cyclophilin family peptidyl-prolyl cis-trans isomerase